MRIAKSAGARVVDASLPKNETNMPPLWACWSASIATTRPLSKLRGTSLATSSMWIRPIPKLSRTPAIASPIALLAIPFAIASSDIPREVNAPPPTSQFPMCPVTSITPLPSSTTVRNNAKSKMRILSLKSSSVARLNLSVATASLPKCA